MREICTVLKELSKIKIITFQNDLLKKRLSYCNLDFKIGQICPIGPSRVKNNER